MIPVSTFLAPFRRIRCRYSQWWLTRELTPLIQQGVGYKQFRFPADEWNDEEAVDRVLGFLREAIAVSRQPYGFSLYLISISAVPPSTIGSGIFQCAAEDFVPPFDRKSFHSAQVQSSIRERVGALNRIPGMEIIIAFNSAGDLIVAHHDARRVSRS